MLGTQEISIAQHGVYYAKTYGFRVLPVCANSKLPALKNWPQTASNDPEAIGKLFVRHTGNIGIACGSGSGLLVIDVDLSDGHNALDKLQKELGSLPLTLSQRTGSGGSQFLFKYPQGKMIKNSAGENGNGLGKNIDIRGEGGMIVCPPSTHPNGNQYYWENEQPLAELPSAWVARLTTSQAKLSSHSGSEWLLPKNALPPGAETEGGKQSGAFDTSISKVERVSHNSKGLSNRNNENSAYGLKALHEECHDLAKTPHGQQNAALARSSFKMGQLVGAGELTRDTAWNGIYRAMLGWENFDEKKSLSTLSRQLDEGIMNPRFRSKEVSQIVSSPKGQPPIPKEMKPKQLLTTEDQLAGEFAVQYKGTLLYCHTSNAWLRWLNGYWQKDKCGYVLQLARELCRQNNLSMKASLGKVSTAVALLKFAASDPVFSRTSEVWDSNPMLLGTPSGTVDLKTGNAYPPKQKDHITRITRVAPAHEANCPTWRSFLDSVTNEDEELQRFLKQIAGYCLTGDVSEHALFFIYGPGGNGKSVFLNTLTSLLGDYATTAAMSTFTATTYDQHPTELAMLQGARLVSASETEEGKGWAENRIKLITGGDMITARYMRQDFFEYLPQFKLLIVGNHEPVLKNVDDAIRRRLNIIPFLHKPGNPDVKLEKNLNKSFRKFSGGR